MTCFGERVFDERSVRLVGVCKTELRLRHDLESERREHLLEFANLAGVAACDDQLFHAPSNIKNNAFTTKDTKDTKEFNNSKSCRDDYSAHRKLASAVEDAYRSGRQFSLVSFVSFVSFVVTAVQPFNAARCAATSSRMPLSARSIMASI